MFTETSSIFQDREHDIVLFQKDATPPSVRLRTCFQSNIDYQNFWDICSRTDHSPFNCKKSTITSDYVNK